MNMQGPFRYAPLKEKKQDQSSYKIASRFYTTSRKRDLKKEIPIQSSYSEFEATELYCPKCRKAVPVIKSLLLILPEGDKYEYRCRFCGTPVGDKVDKHGQYYSILKM